MRVAYTLPLLLLVPACGDDSSGNGAPPPRPPAPASSPVAQLNVPPPQSKESLLAEVRKRQLTNEDFQESENNRDPFRSYLATFAVQPPIVTKQHKIVLQKFSLDELKLVAIVGGEGITPRAMFIDPSGMGVNVVRGDHVSKLDAAVVRIAPDRVFFEWDEDQGGGKAKKVEREVELHAGEVQAQ
jgi:type IV pilus assembly protein PilP